MTHFLYNYFLTRKTSKKKNKLYLWLNWQLYKYLRFHLVAFYKNVSTDHFGTDHDSNIIVSLTSFPARIDLVYLTIRSILNQTQKPKMVMLWLGEEQFPFGEEGLPSSLLELKTLGLEIGFCEDIKAHKKYYYSFQKFPNNVIVTVDDDVIYPTNLVAVLIKTNHLYPNAVVANRVRYMEMEKDSFKPYRQWKINRLSEMGPSKKIFSTGVGGVLYQPKYFLKSLFDIEGIRATNCRNDDIWLKACQIASDIPVVFTNYYFKPFIEIPDSQKESLFSNNVFESDNDRQIVEVFRHFGVTQKSFD